MAGHDSDRAWDEYEWERFLQQQDQKTEKYMELLEKYIDDPQRDEIVAREMGWCHQAEESGEDWNQDGDPLLDDGGTEDEDSANQLINWGRRKFRATRALSCRFFPHDLDRSPF